MKKMALFFGIAIMLPFAAFADSPKTVSWFMNHPAELKDKLNWCQKNPNDSASLECQNAVAAKWERGFKDVPDLGPNKTPKTVTWYVEHQDEMKTRIRWCNDSVERADTEDCKNANRANNQSWADKPAPTGW